MLGDGACATSGDRFDLHTGGIDNVFPHHEDEIAQSAPLVGGPPARHWVHGEFLLMAGRKMAKSAGNFQRVTELAERGLDPLAFRYLALTSRYGAQAQVLGPSLDAAAAAPRVAAGRARGAGPAAGGRAVGGSAVLAAGCGRRPAGGHRAGRRRPSAATGGFASATDRAHAPAAPLSDAGRGAARAVRRRASTTTWTCPARWRCVREILRAPTCPADERRWLILDADAVLGLDLHRVWERTAAATGGDAPSRTSVQALADARTPPAPSATGPAPMRSATSSRRAAGTSSTVPSGSRLVRRGPETTG